MTHNINLVN